MDVGLSVADILELPAGSEIPVNMRGGRDTGGIFRASLLKRFICKLNDASCIKDFNAR